MTTDKKPLPILKRIIRSLRSRSYRTNCSGWYMAPLRTSRQKQSSGTIEKLKFQVLTGENRSILNRWLVENQKRYPWVYFPEEIDAAERYHHWYPCLFDNDKLVGFIKLGRNCVYIHDFEGIIKLPDRVAFVYDTFVDPEYRHRGLAQAMLLNTMSYLEKHGYNKVFCHIEDWNKASVNAFTSVGFSRVGTVRYLRLTLFKWLIIDSHWHRPSKLIELLDTKSEPK